MLLPLWRAIFKPKIIHRVLSGVMAVVWVLVILAAIGAIVGGGGRTQTQIGSLLFTVNGVSPYSDARIPAEAGTHYVAVDLSVKNAGDQTGLNSSDFTVKDSAGYIDLSATTFGPEPLLGLVSIIAGEEVRGFIVFKIANGRDPVELRYRLDLFQNGGVIPLPTPIP